MDCQQNNTHEQSSPRILNLVANDVEKMESILSQVGRNNDLSLIPSRFIPLLHALQRSIPMPITTRSEKAKAEQRTLMCQ